MNQKNAPGWIMVLLAMSMLLLSSTVVHAQNLSETITFPQKEISVKTAFNRIERQTVYKLAYNEHTIDLNAIVNLNSQKVNLQVLLEAITEKTSTKYFVSGNQIVFSFQLPISEEIADSGEYKGTVLDEEGFPLPGVCLIIGNGDDVVITDPNGKFTMFAPKGTVVTCSSLGYTDKEVILGKDHDMTIRMDAENMSLEESVVVGYGSVKRKDLTTAVSVVSTKDLNERPIVDAASALQGKAAGVQVIQPSGMPGSGLSVRVRGATSIQASNEPLYVIDGVPTDDISNISPDDIESMQVLKDASSAAIYGARAANGVVLITTKQGGDNRVSLKFSAYAGFSNLAKRIEALNTEEYKALMKEMAGSTAVVPSIPDDETRYTDWTDVLFGTGVNQNYQLSMSQDTQKLRYYISAGHTDEKGIVNKAYFKRTNFRANIESDMFKWLTLSLNTAFTHSKGREVYESRSSLRAGSIMSAINTPPFMQIWDKNDSTRYDEDAYGARILNPMAANAADMTYISDRFNGALSLDFHIIKGLDYKIRFALDVNNSRNDYYLDPISTSDGRAVKGSVSEGTSRNYEWLFENVINYQHTFGLRHDFNAMLGTTMQHAQWNGNAIAGYDMPVGYPEIHSVSVANQLNEDGTWSSASAWAIQSVFGRLAYNYDSRYLLTVNVRTDGSSRFAPGHRWGVFPSASAAWRISNEKFMKPARTWLDDLKIRFGWGLNGNQGGIGNYSYLAYMRGSKVPATEENAYPGIAISPNSAANPELTWEKTEQFNAGIDMALFNSRVVFNADFYYKKTRDLLLTVSLPDNVNLPGGITRNDGEMTNKGFEFMVSTKNFVREFKWSTDFNISLNRNRVDKLGLNKVYYYANMYETDEAAIILKEGLPLGSFFGYKSLGVNEDTGDIMYEDISGNGTIGPEDRTVIGCAQPKFIYGMTNNFSWKGIYMSIFFQGSYGNDIFNATRIDTEGMFDFRNQAKAVLRRWVRPGMVTDIPRSGNIENIHNSSRFIEDGSYFRLKSLTLGYKLPKKVLSRMHMQGMNFFVTCNNLFTITKYSGYDPEVNAYGASSVALGVDYGTYPQSRSFIFGLNFTF